MVLDYKPIFYIYLLLSQLNKIWLNQQSRILLTLLSSPQLYHGDCDNLDECQTCSSPTNRRCGWLGWNIKSKIIKKKSINNPLADISNWIKCWMIAEDVKNAIITNQFWWYEGRYRWSDDDKELSKVNMILTVSSGERRMQWQGTSGCWKIRQQHYHCYL